jgi:hypothetical protein
MKVWEPALVHLVLHKKTKMVTKTECCLTKITITMTYFNKANINQEIVN